MTGILLGRLLVKMINTNSLNETRKQIQKLKKENPDVEIVVRAQGDEYNRKILENPDVDVLLGVELYNRKDFMKQRDSGLNEIMCKLAKKNNIKIGIDVGEIARLGKIDKARVLARVMQNIELCKRTSADMVVYPVGKFGKQDVMSFILSLGGSTGQGRLN